MYICIYIFHKFLIQITYKNEAIYIFIHYLYYFILIFLYDSLYVNNFSFLF